MTHENRAVLCTAAALCAFAGNSLLTRLALDRTTIDSVTFSAVRLAPVLAGAGGVLFLGEAISRRLVLAAIAVLGGIALALIGREQSRVCVSIDTDHVRPHDGVRGGESS